VTAKPERVRTNAHGRTVMVTGAGSGIGRAVAASLLERGYAVFGGAIDEGEAANLRDALPGSFVPVVIDVRDEESVQAAAERVREELDGRPLHGVLNIAGITTNGPLVDLSAETFAQVLAVNVVGMHAVTRAFLPLQRPGGKVLNMSSASGSRTLPFTGAYSASKFAVEALTSAMRMEFAPLGIDVVVVAPGLVNTPMAGRIQEELAERPSLTIYHEPLRRFRERTVASVEKGIPIERVVETIVGALEAPEPSIRYELHNNFARDVILMRVLPTRLREALVRKSLRLGGEPGPR